MGFLKKVGPDVVRRGNEFKLISRRFLRSAKLLHFSKHGNLNQHTHKAAPSAAFQAIDIGLQGQIQGLVREGRGGVNPAEEVVRSVFSSVGKNNFFYLWRNLGEIFLRGALFGSAPCPFFGEFWQHPRLSKCFSSFSAYF